MYGRMTLPVFRRKNSLGGFNGTRGTPIVWLSGFLTLYLRIISSAYMDLNKGFFTPELFRGGNDTRGFSVLTFVLLHVLQMHTKNELEYKSNQHTSRRENAPYKTVLSSTLWNQTQI